MSAQDAPTAAEIEALKKAAASDPKDIGAHFDLALAYSIAGNDAEAIAEYRKVLAIEPDLYEAHINFGQVLLRSKQPAEAVPPLDGPMRRSRGEFRPAFYLGEALFDLDRFRRGSYGVYGGGGDRSEIGGSGTGLGTFAGEAGQADRGGSALSECGEAIARVEEFPAGFGRRRTRPRAN
ncbi:MAG: tetratricopeptide repeat protein [Acidobacteriota bacterium]